MILHVNFSDGSNPWVSFPEDRHAAAKQWRQWMKNHPLTAQPKIYNNDYVCEISAGRVYVVYKLGQFHATKKYYKHLGHALAALDRLGGN